jgi:hypothetical protein
MGSAAKGAKEAPHQREREKREGERRREREREGERRREREREGEREFFLSLGPRALLSSRRRKAVSRNLPSPRKKGHRPKRRCK